MGMSKRFGRNQRRKLREELEQAQNAAEFYRKDRDSQARWNTELRRRIHSVEASGFQEWLVDTERMDKLLAHMVEQLTARFGDELMPHVQRLLAAAPKPLLSFEARPWDTAPAVKQMVIRGRLAPFSYNMVYEVLA